MGVENLISLWNILMFNSMLSYISHMQPARVDYRSGAHS